MVGRLLGWASALRVRVDRARLERRWASLRARGMHIGADVWLPGSTWIDTSYCYLISIGDHCGFGEECLILTHDAQMDEFLDAARIGRVVIHSSCHIGARTVVLPGVEIGPRTIVGANSVVSRSLPADSVCAGNPARVICGLDEYLAKHRARMGVLPTFEYGSAAATVIKAAVQSGDAYITGGRSAELRGEGGTPRTPSAPATRVPELGAKG